VNCGNGLKQLAHGEDCDDGNSDNGDGCSSVCGIEPNWSCTGNDGTKSVCNPTCGDGVLVGKEKCDHGTGLPGCRDDCSGTKIGWECNHTGLGPSICNIACGDGL